MIERKRNFILIITLILIVISFTYANQEISSITQIIEQYGKAVVLIATVKGEDNSVGLGSGFIVNPSGVIITNYHVIKGAYPAFVKLINGDVYDDISIIDTDQRKDIAIIKIQGWNLPIVKLGNSDEIKVGEPVVVIGNPKGLENTVSDGLISGVRAASEGYKLHQISAPISSGSSGSPVFNREGEVIGIATSSIIEGQNLNFSVPINYARGMISEEVKMSLEEFSKKSTLEIDKLRGLFDGSSKLNQIQIWMSRLQRGQRAGWYYNDYFKNNSEAEIYTKYYPSQTLPVEKTPSSPKRINTPGHGFQTYTGIVAFNDILFSLNNIYFSSYYGGSILLVFIQAEDNEYELYNGHTYWDLKGLKINIFVNPQPKLMNPIKTEIIEPGNHVNINFQLASIVEYQGGNLMSFIDSFALYKTLQKITNSLSNSSEDSGLIKNALSFAHAFLHAKFKAKIGHSGIVEEIEISDNYCNIVIKEK